MNELPIFEPDKPKGYYSRYRIVSESEWFYPQYKFLFWWFPIKFTGTTKFSSSIVIRSEFFRSFDEAKWVIDYVIAERESKKNKTIHHLS